MFLFLLFFGNKMQKNTKKLYKYALHNVQEGVK